MWENLRFKLRFKRFFFFFDERSEKKIIEILNAAKVSSWKKKDKGNGFK